MEKELAIVLPYLFDSDLQYNSGDTPSMVSAIIAAGIETEQLITMPVKLAMLQSKCSRVS